MTPALAIAFPLTIATDRHHVVDASGEPVLFQGDAAWSLIANLTLDETVEYLDDRQAKGFNALIINLVEYLFAADPPRNRAGVDPFHTPGVFGTVNEEYMAHAENVLRLCAERNIVVFLAPAYLGYLNPGGTTYAGNAQGWYDEVLANGPAGCRAWGEYLGERFGSFENIVWCIGGDRNPEAATSGLTEIVRGLRSRESSNLFVAHVAPEWSALDLPGLDWVDLNMTYTYEIVHRHLIDDWLRVPPTPTWLVESTYEGEHDASDLQIRRQAYWSVLCGGFGHCMGNKPIWLFDPGWRAALDMPASMAMMHFGDFFRGLPWADLVPDLERSIVTGDLGEARGLDRVCAAATEDRAVAVAYLPVKRQITIAAMAVVGEQASVEWFEPSTGSRQSGDNINATETVTLLPPYAGDAVLTLRRIEP